MARKKTSKYKKRRFLRLLALNIFFMLLNEVSNAEHSIPCKIEYRLKKISDENILNLKFVIEGTSFSNIDIEIGDASQFLILKQKKQYLQMSNTVLELQYKILKIGKLVLNNFLLKIDGKSIKQDTITLNIEPTTIKSASQFRVRIFEYANNLIEHNTYEPLILGEKYLLVVEGLFKKKIEKISVVPIFKTNVLKEKNNKELNYLSQDGWHVLYSCFVYPLNTGLQNFGKFEIVVEQYNEKRKFIIEIESVKIIKNKETKPNTKKNKLQKQLEQILSL